jgi:CheY-like chemotaxis protein
MEVPMKKIRILIADDEPIMRDIMVRALKTFDYHIDVAKNGHEAVDQIRHISYDLIISDYDMPQMNGLELIRWVNSNRPEVPVIIVTGTAPVQKNLQSEATACILKPFTLLKFQKAVRQSLNCNSNLKGMT